MPPIAIKSFFALKKMRDLMHVMSAATETTRARVPPLSVAVGMFGVLQTGVSSEELSAWVFREMNEYDPRDPRKHPLQWSPAYRYRLSRRHGYRNRRRQLPLRQMHPCTRVLDSLGPLPRPPSHRPLAVSASLQQCTTCAQAPNAWAP